MTPKGLALAGKLDAEDAEEDEQRRSRRARARARAAAAALPQLLDRDLAPEDDEARSAAAKPTTITGREVDARSTGQPMSQAVSDDERR